MDPSATPRLSAAGRTLEPLRVEHADEMVAVLADPALYTFTGGEPPSVERLRDRYAAQVAGDPDGHQTWHNWVMRDPSGAAVGYVQATVEGDDADLAWVVGTPFQRRGHARAAALAVAGWLRDTGTTRLVAHVHRDHLASTAVARALGLTAVGRLVDGEVEWAAPATAPAVAIGPARRDVDLDDVIAFWAVAAENDARPVDTTDALRHLLDRDPGALLTATIGDVLVGTVIAGHDGWRSHLYRLAVHPTWRGRGIARDLVAAAENRFRALGATRVDAMVLDANDDGRALWTRLGHTPQDDWSRWVKPL